MSITDITVRAEYTPNQTHLSLFQVRLFIHIQIHCSYINKAEAEAIDNKLAQRLFDIEGIKKVFVMRNFVTIDKEEHINWKDIHLEIKEIIKASLKDMPEWAEKNKPEEPEHTGEDGDDRARIETVLNKIRPALVADGGNIELVDIVNKDARLRMVGACGTCPSSMMTMKMGVERALLAEVPDLVETVTQVF